ncbi:hypothetical protein HYH03_003451 [Edaphochlamys debaryana]|uniref:Uncharacterized protein n=1 Tax=Edaphochlamys debaryana TaxID=47281 RepID=A0A835YD86_9CHLO|nr:hypothetical protein HYH03_003451 [Edaphochlamys debaryana]|eukprot:KAG2498711.1 hypothetical protein HYH03_003451 [Edaphochlamys debaryana]
MRALQGRSVSHSHQQASCSSALLLPPVRCPSRARAAALRVQAQGSNGAKPAPKQLKFFYFDPLNPEDVREVSAKPKSPSIANSNGNGALVNGAAHLANGHSHPGSNGALHNGSNGVSTASQLVQISQGKEAVAVQRLQNQLEEARSAVVKMQQYEVMYKESRMRSKQMQAEVTQLQTLLAEKDAELARQYKRMESEASERSGLRSQFNTAIDEVKALRNELEEARQAMLELRGVIPTNVTLRRGTRSPSGLLEDGSGTSPDVLSSLQGLAKQLAEGMEQEVGSLFGSGAAAGSGGKRDA